MKQGYYEHIPDPDLSKRPRQVCIIHGWQRDYVEIETLGSTHVCMMVHRRYIKRLDMRRVESRIKVAAALLQHD